MRDWCMFSYGFLPFYQKRQGMQACFFRFFDPPSSKTLIFLKSAPLSQGTAGSLSSLSMLDLSHCFPSVSALPLSILYLPQCFTSFCALAFSVLHHSQCFTSLFALPLSLLSPFQCFINLNSLFLSLL